MRILITGLDGFTGPYVQSEMEAHGHIVTGLNSNLTNADAVAAEIKLKSPEAVVHLAGITFINNANANAFYDVNLIGTRNLLAALAKHAPKVQSILLASSASVYGNNSGGILSEENVPDPANDYAVSKLAMEKMANLWNEQLPIFILRLFNYTGVNQDIRFLIPKIVSHFQENKPVIKLGNLDVWREFGDVRGIANIYRKLLENPPIGQTLNICTGQAYSLREAVALCEKITGHHIEIQCDPKFIRDNEVRTLTGDNTRLKNLIGEFQLNNLEDTLRWMLQTNTTLSE
jgi:GDP-6-deoxy-D-talose 4-dehydrogenase